MNSGYRLGDPGCGFDGGDDFIAVREVGLRDGLQLISQTLPTARKRDWIDSAVASGLRHLEVTSFVPSQIMPQFTDADAVVNHALRWQGLDVIGLALNRRGGERGLASGVSTLVFVLSASEAHAQANTGRSAEEALAALRSIVALRDAQPEGRRTRLVGAIATAFGCTFQGQVSPNRIRILAQQLASAGVDEIALADTVGYANPTQVRSLFREIAREVAPLPMAAHFHDTRGLGLANVLAALDVGVRRFDASLAGLGGCPFAPGASGNIAVEDLVFMLESMGLSTGINCAALLDMHRRLHQWLPDVTLRAAVAEAGLPLDYRASANSGAHFAANQHSSDQDYHHEQT